MASPTVSRSSVVTLVTVACIALWHAMHVGCWRLIRGSEN
jgi:hypothetical protein